MLVSIFRVRRSASESWISITDEPVAAIMTGFVGGTTTVLEPMVAALWMVTLLSKPVALIASENSSSSAPESKSRVIVSRSGGNMSGLSSNACRALSEGMGTTELFPVSCIAPSCTERKVLVSSLPKSTCILIPFTSASVKFTTITVFGTPLKEAPPVREYVLRGRVEESDED